MKRAYFLMATVLLLGLSILNSCKTSEKQPIPKFEEKAKITDQENIIVYGDTRTNHDVHRRVVNQIVKNKPVAVFHTGDLVTLGNIKKQWKTFNEITQEIQKNSAFYPALGNHENDSKNFYDNFELPNNEQWYHVKIKGLDFIVLNSNVDMWKDSEQYNWLVKKMEEIGKEKFLCLIFHHPIFSTGRHGSMKEKKRKELTDLFEKYDVDVVFNGHDHHYERSENNNIFYVVAGGGGAPLRKQSSKNDYSKKYLEMYHFCRLTKDNKNVKVEVISDDFFLIDEFVVKP